MLLKLANKRKGKFLDDRGASAALHQVTEFDAPADVLGGIMQVLDKVGRGEVPHAMLKTALPIIIKEHPADQAA